MADPPPASWLTPRPPIPVTVHDYLAMSGGGVLRLVFELDPWDSLIYFESGIPVQLGGTLELTFADEVHVATQVGRTLRIFDWSGVTPTGVFSVASPYVWNLSRLYTTGEVTHLVVPEPSAILLFPSELFLCRFCAQESQFDSQAKTAQRGFGGLAMLSIRAAHGFRFFSVLLLVILATGKIAKADIFRWNNGQVIPGAEGITPGRGVHLDSRQLSNLS